MLVLEWLVKENKMSYIVEWKEYSPYEDENFKYVLLPDDIVPNTTYEFFEFIHTKADEGFSILDKDGNKTECYDSIIALWNLTPEYIKKELKEIEKWFADNDYRVNKRFLGEYEEDSPEWIQYKLERATKRARHRELKSILGY